MTDKQEKFINNLIDQFGYKDSPVRANFWNRLFRYDSNIGTASGRIETLLTWNKERKFSRKKTTNFSAVQSVSDLAQFVFCPASYSIKRSYKPNIDSTEERSEQPNTSILLEWLEAMKQVTDREKQRRRDESVMVAIESASLLFNGYLSESPILYNKYLDLSGKPHLIFEAGNEKILVLEKHTYKEHPVNTLYPNNLIQALAYLTLFTEFQCNRAIIISWSDASYYSSILSRKYKTFTLELNDENIQLLLTELKKFKHFLDTRKSDFDLSSLNVNKCYHCDVKAICNHKSALLTNLSIPYSTPEFDKLYPFFYTALEFNKGMSKEIVDDMIKSDQEEVDLYNSGKQSHVIDESYWDKLKYYK